LEAVLVPRAGLRFHAVPASGFRGLGSGARLRFVLNFAAGVARALGLLVGWRPHVVLGTGGYASAPVMTAAHWLRVPLALQEQNAVPGTANRLVARWASRIYLGVEAARAHFARNRCIVTGNPVRPEFVASAAEPSTAGPPAPDGRLRLLVFGGSRGARTLNRAVCGAAADWTGPEGPALWLQTGRDDLAMVRNAYAAGGDRVRVEPFIEAMPAALRWADLVICRSGAMTLAELQAVGRPAILVPFPHATDDHQTGNALQLAERGAARVLADADCDGPRLVALVAELTADRAALRQMAAAAQSLARPDAAERIARDLLVLGGRPSAQGETHVS
jgi:UDP-N-acetylglucosamine--N-acetylmuramyl-(pentapeptide) pyrophosphoryl-undecaprenol N-acetylglucosamine transferase